MKTSSALEAAVQVYLKAHFYDGVASVYSMNNMAREYIIQIVGNKYSPANYWCVLVLGALWYCVLCFFNNNH